MIEQMSEYLANALLLSGVSSLILSLFMHITLQYLWGMVNALQLAVYLPVFSLQFPGLASLVYSILLEIVTFNFDQFEDELIDFFELDRSDIAFADEFTRVGIEQRTFIIGSGLFLFILLSLLPVILIITCMILMKSKVRCFVWFKANFMKTFIWSFFLRSLFEFCLELSLLSMIDVYVSNYS